MGRDSNLCMSRASGTDAGASGRASGELTAAPITQSALAKGVGTDGPADLDSGNYERTRGGAKAPMPPSCDTSKWSSRTLAE